MTASSGSAAASSIVTLNDASYNFDSITASTASFALVDNGGVAWSKFSPPAANLAGFNKLLIATTIREDVYAALMSYAASSNTAYLQIGQRSASQFRVTGLGATAKFTGVVGATEKKVLISLDFSKTELSDQMMCFSDGVRAALDSSSSSNHLTGDYIFSSNDAFGNSTIPFGLFAAGGGSRITNAAMGFFWMDFYTPSEAMPDIRDPDVRAAFSAERLGADGSSDLFGQPLWYYQGTAAEWNAGMANKGSLIAPLTVGAGGFA